MKRLGKFYMNRDIVMDGMATEVFTRLQFVPHRAELMAMCDRFEYIGTSPLFEQIAEGMIAREYRIEINEHPDPEIDELVVAAIAI